MPRCWDELLRVIWPKVVVDAKKEVLRDFFFASQIAFADHSLDTKFQILAHHSGQNINDYGETYFEVPGIIFSP